MTKNIKENIKYEDFESMNLNESLLRGIYRYGFDKPSPIQSIGIKPVVEGNDSIIQAQSGCGKTATFCIASLELVEESIKKRIRGLQ